jgi:aminoglycoside phosphotransferase (APT) family kinase protein
VSVQTPATSHPAAAADVDAVITAVRRAMGARSVTEAAVLADVPGGRFVLRCCVDGTTVVVRCLPSEAATQQFRYLEALSSARSGVLRVPAPLASVAPVEDLGSGSASTGMSALVLEHLDGSACTRLVARHGATPAGVATMHLAGRALAELHAIDPAGVPALRHADAGDHLADLVRPFPDRLASAVPAWGAVIERALHHVRSVDRQPHDHRSSDHGRSAVLHRDVHLRQLFRHDGRMGLIDWDLAAVGDPAFDVAYLLTHLDTHVVAAGELIAAVLDGYGDASMTAERLAPYRSFNLLRRACRRFRLRDEGWEPEMHRMLQELSSTLDVAGVPS